MKYFDVKFISFFFLIALQLACGQTQTASNVNQDDTANATKPNANSIVNKIEDQRKEVDYFAHLKPEHKEVLRAWLIKKPYLRPAIEETDSILDKSALEDIHKYSINQFYSVADFNKDKQEDFALLLIDTRGKDRFAFAIFNGEVKKGQSPNYYEENLEGISNCYLDFGGMDENYLYLGVYEGDRYCMSYIPKGNTYKFRDCI